MSKLSDMKKRANEKAQAIKNKQDQKRAAEVIETINTERRFKAAYVRGDFLLHWFTKGLDNPSENYITIVDGAPENVLVLGVDYEPRVAAFMFLLGSLEFEPVPEGEQPPSLNIKVRVGDGKK